MQDSAASNANTPQKKKSILILVLSSFTCWLIVSIVGLNWLIQTVKPLQYIKTTRYVPLEQNPLVSKLPAFFDAKEHPDLLVLGSSLPMEAIARYDAEYTGAFNEKSLNEVRQYTGAKYLEHLIEQKNGTKLSAFNLTCVACMASDAELILRRAIDAGRAPKIVIFGIGPRDFIDNIVPPPGKSPVCQLLSNRITLPEIFAEARSLDETRDLLLGQLVYLYKVRTDYKTMLTGWACDLFAHPADLYESNQLAKLSQKEEKTRQVCKVEQTTDQTSNNLEASGKLTLKQTSKRAQFADLPEWKERYRPANNDRFEKEKAAFQKMLAICKEKSIRMIVVNMPLTKENKDIVPKKLLVRYQNEICAMPAQFGDEMLDLDASGEFQLSDFYDSAHVNAHGGKKVQDLMVSSAKTLAL
ncbi:MAG: hypothetical protein K2Y39_15490 [Candidatus Obscuribacterales bacterium]|nr:hypothetical protein [Candidatus Obscuribacterales bacterium]